MTSEPFVTFITATVGRPSLQAAVDSVMAQTSGRWKHIVMGDGVMPEAESDDPRITYLMAPHRRHESPTRNLAVSCATTEWVAFLDDDDVLDPHYVGWLEEEIRATFPDVVIFRQTFPSKTDGEHIVFPNRPEIVWGNVGISYAVRRTWCSRFPFKESRHEDLLQLVALEAAGARIHFSDHLAYYARGAVPTLTVA